MKKTINSIALVLFALTVLVSSFAFSSCVNLQAAQGEPDAEVNAEVPDTDVDVLGGIGSNAVEEADEETTFEEETTAAPMPEVAPEEPVAPAEPTEPTAPSADPVVQEPEASIDTSAPSQDLIDRIEATLSSDVFYVRGYYGTYNGASAVKIGGGSELTVITEVTVADVEFVYPTHVQIKIWKDGTFYSMENAYDQGLLTKADIEMIHGFWVSGGLM